MELNQAKIPWFLKIKVTDWMSFFFSSDYLNERKNKTKHLMMIANMFAELASSSYSVE